MSYKLLMTFDKIKLVIFYAITGAGFWLPSILYHLIRAKDFGSSLFDIIFLNLICIIFSLSIYLLSIRRKSDSLSLQSKLFMILIGMWLFGPFASSIIVFFQGKFILNIKSLISLLSGIPLSFIYSVYDGTFFAFTLVNVILIIGIVYILVKIFIYKLYHK